MQVGSGAIGEAIQGKKDIAAFKEARNQLPAEMGMEEAFFLKLAETIKGSGFSPSY